ncbi:MAG: hypothetical protein ACKV2T_39950 [Kofleriaceae bacterium]
MGEYDEAKTVRDARELYFDLNGFSAATYSEPWVRFKVGFLPVVFPNTASRKRAIPLHDLHHIATGYATTLVGEAEIGAWEVGGSCTNYWAAWVLNLSAVWYGLLIAPHRVYRAFVRGRHSRTLYRSGWSDALLNISVGELRASVLPPGEVRATWEDRAAFAACIALVMAPTVALMLLARALLA